FYYPYSFYAAPFYSTRFYPYYAYPPYPAYATPPPAVVEHYYIEDLPPPPQYSYGERSYAQSAPPAEPQRAPAPHAPRIERMTLSARELFGFDEARLRTPQPKLDEIAAAMVRSPQIDRVTITG